MSGDAADEVVRIMLNGTEVAVRLAGSGMKNLAAMLIAWSKKEKKPYKDEDEKLAMLARLLPFIEKRLNLLELAPKGTGKSYVFGNVSKYGLLTDGGKITRTKMFYDKSRRAPGFIVGNDYVAIDEVKLVTFDNINEMRSVMQGYMERGRFNVDGYDGESFAGVVLLGNISIENMDEYTSMFSELPVLFQESALVDRIHGFIKGWDIPKMKDNLKVSGWALNSEYFCTVMHMLRDDASYHNAGDHHPYRLS